MRWVCDLHTLEKENHILQHTLSLSFLPWSSATNSQDVGPPPTTINDKSRFRSSSTISGMAAFSKESIMLFRICIAWWMCLRKKTPFPSFQFSKRRTVKKHESWMPHTRAINHSSFLTWMDSMLKVFVLTPTAMTSLSYSNSKDCESWIDSQMSFLFSGSKLRALAWT